MVPRKPALHSLISRGAKLSPQALILRTRALERGEGEYEDIVKNEVQRAISAMRTPSPALRQPTSTTSRRYTQRERCATSYTGQYEEPDEAPEMRAIEEKIDIPESRQGRLPPRDLNYIRRPGHRGGRRSTTAPTERLHKAGAEAVRGPEGLDQLKKLVSSVVEQEHAGEDRIVKEPDDQVLRVLRDLQHRRAQLRGVDSPGDAKDRPRQAQGT